VVVPGGPGTAADLGPDAPRQTGRIDADGVRLRIDVAPDGDANWTIEYRVRLGEPNRTAAFESLQQDIRANGSEYRDRFGRRMARTAQTAANATGREMAIRNVTVSARMQSVPQEFGFVTYRFEWTNFARTDGAGELVVGDALAGLFLDRGTTLVVAWPATYDATDIRPGPPDRRFDSRVVWNGPTDFGSNEPRVLLASTNRGGGLLGGSGPPAVVAIVIAVVAVVGVVWWRRGGLGSIPGTGPDTPAADSAGTSRSADADVGDAPASAADGGTTAGTAGGRRDADDGSRPTAPESAADAGTEVAAGAASGTAADVGTDADTDTDATGHDGDGDSGDEAAREEADESASPDEERVPMELLSPEERVMRLVTERGGRIKQQEVVSELDWSAARTSQVVSSLRDDGQIETFRLGRENVLKLPEEGE
jgi:hypothetical protein